MLLFLQLNEVIDLKINVKIMKIFQRFFCLQIQQNSGEQFGHQTFSPWMRVGEGWEKLREMPLHG